MQQLINAETTGWIEKGQVAWERGPNQEEREDKQAQKDGAESIGGGNREVRQRRRERGWLNREDEEGKRGATYLKGKTTIVQFGSCILPLRSTQDFPMTYLTAF